MISTVDMAIFETKHLRKTFGGVHAVDNVDLSFEAGKITALIGPNGSGKTTLINVVTGLLPQDGGVMVMDARVYFFDEPFAGLFREVARKISDILQMRGRRCRQHVPRRRRSEE